MKLLKTLGVVLALMANATGQNSSNPNLATFLKRAEQDARAMEKAHISALKSADVGRYTDLAEKTLAVIDAALPAAYDQYQELLKGKDGILHGDAGRWHSQNSEVVEIIMRFATEDLLPAYRTDPDNLDVRGIDFGENERKQRSILLKETLAALKKDTGVSFDASQSRYAKLIDQNASWASRAWETLNQRKVLIEGYLNNVVQGVDVSKLPTMQEEIEAIIHRRMVTLGKAINQVEREAAEERAKRMAEVTRGVEVAKLEDHIREVTALAEEQRKLDRAIAEAEIQDIKLATTRKEQQTDAEFERELAALRDEKAALQKELAMKAVDLDKVKAQAEDLVKKLKVAENKRKMPQDSKVLLRVLSAPGYWAPKAFKVGGQGGVFYSVEDSRYDTLQPQPHSLTTLAAMGALSDDPRGYLTLYMIMAAAGDKERPRYSGAIDVVSNGGLFLPNNQFSAVFTQNEDTRALLKKLQAIQALINEFGEQLVADGSLAP